VGGWRGIPTGRAEQLVYLFVKVMPETVLVPFFPDTV